MAFEIERKFLVASDIWKEGNPVSTLYVQGYVSNTPGKIVRVRIAGESAYLTLKKRISDGEIGSYEFEYAIPVADAKIMLEQLCEPGVIEKTRYKIPIGGHTWEVDVFHGVNDGLVVAEVELSRADESIDIPDWVGEEVTNDYRYSNASLAQNPYHTW